MTKVTDLLQRGFQNDVACGIMAGLQELEEGKWISVLQLLSDLHYAGVLSMFCKEHETLFHRVLNRLIGQRKIVRRIENSEEEVKLPSRDDKKLALAA